MFLGFHWGGGLVPHKLLPNEEEGILKYATIYAIPFCAGTKDFSGSLPLTMGSLPIPLREVLSHAPFANAPYH